jgi:Fanconi anemia group M protein
MPFHDIFSKNSKRIKKKINPLIIADIHEKNSLVISELSENKEIDLIIKSLKIGDYLIGTTIIERKTISDFIGSMISKRLLLQLNQMQKYNQKMLIIEGEFSSLFNKDVKVHSNAIRGMILYIINNHCPIIFTKDYKDTAKYIIILAKQQLKKSHKITLHSKIPKTISEQKNYIIESLPNIGPITAKKLLQKFKTIKNIFNAKEDELKEILGKKYDSFNELINK